MGSSGFFPRGGPQAQFDQQPIEAHATVSACLEAYRCSGDPAWHAHASAAFEWFLGRNDLNQPLYDAASGGCRDGLHVDRMNENQGAESTLAFLIALSEMELLENHLKVFTEPMPRSADVRPSLELNAAPMTPVTT